MRFKFVHEDGCFALNTHGPNLLLPADSRNTGSRLSPVSESAVHCPCRFICGFRHRRIGRLKTPSADVGSDFPLGRHHFASGRLAGGPHSSARFGTRWSCWNITKDLGCGSWTPIPSRKVRARDNSDAATPPRWSSDAGLFWSGHYQK